MQTQRLAVRQFATSECYCMMLSSFVWVQYQHVIVRQTDGFAVAITHLALRKGNVANGFYLIERFSCGRDLLNTPVARKVSKVAENNEHGVS